MFARRHGGTFILRIEDTDEERNREEWVAGICEAMAWLGLDPDEGPYFQSERSDRHREAARLLFEAGYLYACECTRDVIEERTRSNATPGYDGFCRERALSPGPGRALRFKVPKDGETVVEDLIRGEVSFPHRAIEDFVVVKSSGTPLFVLANVVDDLDMGITHVIRGEDLLPSTPKAILIWQALGGGGLPAFAHLPMLVNEKGKKLSKRRDPVAVESYRDQGYLPDAMRNYLALLGWSPPGGTEIMPVEEMVESFDLGAVNHSPAFFDVVKLTHVNGEYIRAMELDSFVEACRPWLDQGPWQPECFDELVFRRLAPLAQERMSVLADVVALVDFAFMDEPCWDPASWAKAIGRDGQARSILCAAAKAYESCRWLAADIKEATLAVAEEAGRKLAKAQAPIRVALTGRTVGLPLFESLEVLGRQRALLRLNRAIERIDSGWAPGD